MNYGVYSVIAWNCALCRDLWVKRIESTSRQFLDTERKKRERAHSCKWNLVQRILWQVNKSRVTTVATLVHMLLQNLCPYWPKLEIPVPQNLVPENWLLNDSSLLVQCIMKQWNGSKGWFLLMTHLYIGGCYGNQWVTRKSENEA